MGKVTLGYGTALILLGVVFYGIAALGLVSANASVTALIPSFIGVPFIILGGLATANVARKHVMHAAAALALLVGLMGLYMGIKGIVGGLERPLAVVAQLIMAALSAGFVGLCVKSFIEARKARTAGFEVVPSR